MHASFKERVDMMLKLFMRILIGKTLPQVNDVISYLCVNHFYQFFSANETPENCQITEGEWKGYDELQVEVQQIILPTCIKLYNRFNLPEHQ